MLLRFTNGTVSRISPAICFPTVSLIIDRSQLILSSSTLLFVCNRVKISLSPLSVIAVLKYELVSLLTERGNFKCDMLIIQKCEYVFLFRITIGPFFRVLKSQSN